MADVWTWGEQSGGNCWRTTRDITRQLEQRERHRLGQPAGRKLQQGTLQVWARPLSDGTIAVGLFNLGSSPA